MRWSVMIVSMAAAGIASQYWARGPSAWWRALSVADRDGLGLDGSERTAAGALVAERGELGLGRDVGSRITRCDSRRAPRQCPALPHDRGSDWGGTVDRGLPGVTAGCSEAVPHASSRRIGAGRWIAD